MVTYCGLEIASTGQGLSVCQSKYVEEFLHRHPEITEAAATPYSGWRDAYNDTKQRDECPDPAEIKLAQSLTGEALWLVVRSRPDLTFAVTRMSQLSTKRPRDAISIGHSVLKFLKGTQQEGLLFGPSAGTLGSRDQLTRPETAKSLNVHSDASFAPGGDHAKALLCTRQRLLSSGKPAGSP